MSEQASGLHSIRVKLGASEFEATGTKESVDEQYKLFLEAIKAQSAPAAVAAAAGAAGEKTPPAGSDPAASDGVPDEIINRAFSIEGDSVSLNVLPSSENRDADTILLLLWGYQKLRGMNAVGATPLAASARKSGLAIDRIDRVVAPVRQYYQTGGQRKGMRYSLNNPGRAYAGRMLRGLFQ
ncbi:MAG: hypothetical protein JSS51_05470 [Planctomycetes bacterium]|nr:hypothetical protein [Planctomycetota bacterium]